MGYTMRNKTSPPFSEPGGTADIHQTPVRVLYIAGTGRSGSTVLNAILGSHPNCVEVGELTNLVEQGWIQELYCACGRRAPECPFWKLVRQEWRTRLGEEDLARYCALQRRFERRLRWPFVGLESRLRTRSFLEYVDRTQALLGAIRTVSGKSVVVDSSKGPVRALCLTRMPGVDLRMIHLIRDARGVAFSLLRSYKKDVAAGVQRDFSGRSVVRSALLWRIANRLTSSVRHGIGPDRAMLARYEDLVVDPGSVLRKVGALAQLDFEPVIQALERGASVAPGHTIAGNRLRMAGPIRLRLDETWKQNLSARERRIVSLIAGRTLGHYGYA